LVGSRRGEINSLGGILIDACNIITQKIPNAVFLFSFEKKSIFDLFSSLIHKHRHVSFDYRVFFQETSNCIKASQLVISKSGTVSLEVALAKKPMIVCYKVSKITEWLIRRKIKIQYISQPNILLNQSLVPELLQNNANSESLALSFVGLYHNQDLQKQMVDNFTKLHRCLNKVDFSSLKTAILKLISTNP
jgi:lipid-A-disaccharide synthase